LAPSRETVSLAGYCFAAGRLIARSGFRCRSIIF